MAPGSADEKKIMAELESLVERAEASLARKFLDGAHLRLEQEFSKRRLRPSRALLLMARLAFAMAVYWDLKEEAREVRRCLLKSLDCLKELHSIPNAATSQSHRLFGDCYAQLIEHPDEETDVARLAILSKEHFDQAVQMDPENAEAHLSRGVWKLFAPCLMGGGQKEGLAEMLHSLSLEPGNARTHVWLGKAYCLQGDNYRAQRHFREALKLQPANPWVRREAGGACSQNAARLPCQADISRKGPADASQQKG